MLISDSTLKPGEVWTNELVREEEEGRVSLRECYPMDDGSTATTFKFEKYVARFHSSELVTYLQSGRFITPFPNCQLTWRVRCFKDLAQKPAQYRMTLHLLESATDERLQVARVSVTCQLRIGHVKHTSYFNFEVVGGQMWPTTRRSVLEDPDTLDRQLSEARRNGLRVGLVLYLNSYDYCVDINHN